MTKRIEYIDALRGFTMFLVVFGHVWYYSFGQINDKVPITDFFMSFRMPLFFFISGFIASRPYGWFGNQNYIKAVKHKSFVQLVPVAIFFSVCAIAHGQTPLSFFYQGLRGYWFTQVLFEMFIIYYSISWITEKLWSQRIQNIVLVFFALLSVIVYFFIHHTTNNIVGNVLQILNLTWFFPFFVIGILCRRFKDVAMDIIHNNYIYTH